MTLKNNRDDFTSKTRDIIAKRAAFICSNPECRYKTLKPSDSNPDLYIFTGKAAHITAASPGGPRYDPELTPEQRSSSENGIFLCSTCAEMIDKNSGVDYPVELLKQWKIRHKDWLMQNPPEEFADASNLTVVDGEHYAEGIGEISALHIEGPSIIKPGTKSTATGIGKVTATHIGPSRKETQ